MDSATQLTKMVGKHITVLENSETIYLLLFLLQGNINDLYHYESCNNLVCRYISY